MPKGIYARGKWWWTRFSIGGIEYREPLRVPVGTAKDERLAIQRAAAIRDRVTAQTYGEAVPIPWPDAVLQWHEDAIANNLRPSTIIRYATSLKQVHPMLGHLDVQAITAATIRAVTAARRKEGATNATIRRDLTAISRVLNSAIDMGWRDDNPAMGGPRRSLPERRDPIALPIPREVAAVIAQAPSRFADLIAFAHETGMRQEEAAALKHDQIDRGRMVATITVAKARRVRAVPLTALAVEIIDRQNAHYKSGWAFWQGQGARLRNVSSDFRRYRRQAAQKAAQAGEAFTGFRFHDLRHDFAVRYLKNRRGSIYDLQQVLGHASLTTTEIYLSYLSPEEAARAKK